MIERGGRVRTTIIDGTSQPIVQKHVTSGTWNGSSHKEGYISPMADEASNGSEAADNRTPFERFENLTRKVVAVPKAEVDALRKKQQKARLRAAARKRA